MSQTRVGAVTIFLEEDEGTFIINECAFMDEVYAHSHVIEVDGSILQRAWAVTFKFPDVASPLVLSDYILGWRSFIEVTWKKHARYADA